MSPMRYTGIIMLSWVLWDILV